MKTRMGLCATSFFLVLAISLISGCEAKVFSAKLQGLNGTVQTRVGPQAAFADAKEGDVVQTGTTVKTGEDGRVKLVFTEGGELDIMPDSLFEIGKDQNLGNQTEGAVWYKLPKQKEQLQIRSPHGVTAILGTRFFIKIATDSSSIGLEEGSISFTADKTGEVKVLSPLQRIVVQSSGKIAGPDSFNPADEEFRFIKMNGKWIREK
jgi:hypothetical protein